MRLDSYGSQMPESGRASIRHIVMNLPLMDVDLETWWRFRDASALANSDRALCAWSAFVAGLIAVGALLSGKWRAAEPFLPESVNAFCGIKAGAK